MKIRILAALFVASLWCSHVSAQQTQTSVTGTVVDPNSVPYYPATVLACLTPAVTNPTVAGAAISTNPGAPYCVGPAQTGSTGTFQIPLYANSVIQCNNVACSTQWQFTVTASGTAPPAGKGAQNFQVVTSITNLTAQDISGVLTAAAPVLLNSGGGGGSVGPGTPNFIGCFSIPTNLQNCVDAITDVSGVVTVPAQLVVGGGASAASIALPSGATSGCQTPTAGVNILCSDGPNGSFDQSINGGAYTPIAGTSAVGAGVIGQPAAYDTSGTVNNAPIYIAVDVINGAGIGAAPTAWVTGTTYPLCQVVSHSGNYIATSTVNGATTPGGNFHIWYPIPNGSRPTQFDCAFYIAQASVTGSVGVDLQLGSGTYNSCIGMHYQNNYPNPGAPGVNIIGAGVNTSVIKQTCTLLSGSGGDGLAMLDVPAAATAFFLPRLQFKNFTLDANALAWNWDLHACQQCTIDYVDLLNPAPGSDHAFEAGTVGGTNSGWVYELDMQHSSLVYNAGTTGFGHGNGAARATVTTSGGVPTITVTNGGTGYDIGQLSIRLVKTGGGNACSTPGTTTATIATGVITAVTSTATGCGATGTVFVQFYPGLQVAYGYRFSNMTDSDTISNLDPGVGATCAVYTQNTDAFNVYYKIHPQGVFNGICANGNEVFIGTQIDSVYNHGIEIASSFNQLNFINTGFEWNNSHYEGSSDYFFASTSNPPVSSPAAINISGDYCGNVPQQDGYAHLVTASGVVDTGNALPPRVNIYNTMYCNQYGTATQPNFTNLAQDIVWGNGNFTNYWDFNLGASGNATMTISNSLGAPWTWLMLDPTAATSGSNSAAPVFEWEGQYWDGTVTQPYGPRFRETFAAGTGPLATFRFDHVGTEPAGGHIWTFDAGVTLPTGTTVPTATAGDSTTAPASTAFVTNAVAGVSGTSGCTTNCNYILGQGDAAIIPFGTGVVATGSNAPQVMQFYNSLSRKLGNACVRVVTLSAAGHFDVGLYSVSGTAGTLQWHTGSQSTASANTNICVTPTAFTLAAGTNYYLAWCADNTTAILAGVSNSSAVGGLLAAGTAHTFGPDAAGGDACTTGVLPNSITTTNITNNTAVSMSVPVVYVNN